MISAALTPSVSFFFVRFGLTYLPWIAGQSRPDKAQVWVLRAANRPAEDPWSHMEKIASRRGTTATALYDAEKLTNAELGRNPLED